MTSKEISDALRTEMGEALNAAGIWHIDAMGWVGPDTVDPEFVGHAMWTVEPPLDIDWSAFGTRQLPAEPANAPPPEWLKLLAISGADFQGLIKAARMSIGLLLIQTRIIVSAEFSDDDFFELHSMSAVIYLAMAADRLREFFVAAAFRQTQDEYRARGKSYRGEERTWYATPFLEAQEVFTSSESLRLLEKLHAMTLKVRKIRDKRNDLVHVLATSMGHRERQRLREQQAPPADPENISFAEWKEAAATIRDERAEKIEAATKELADWYMLLMRASNEAFIFEHGQRKAP
jgi:hypothetical protein